MRLVLVNVQSRTCDRGRFERVEERLGIDHASPADIHQEAGRSKRLKHRGVNHVTGGSATGGSHDQDVDSLGKLPCRWEMAPRQIRPPPAGMIGDGHLERLCPARDLLADAAHAHDPEAPARRERWWTDALA